jgi:linoleoyl-CoA desaturase
MPFRNDSIPAITSIWENFCHQVNDISDEGSMPRPKFPKDKHRLLHELRRRADEYFAKSGRSKRDCWQMYLKTMIILIWLVTSYTLLVFVTNTFWLAIPLAVSLSLSVTAVAFSIQHDGSHQAYSRYFWVNRLAAMTLDMIGASSYLWRWKHIVYHHTYPNVAGQDTDIDVGVFARFSPHQRRRWFHQWQHIYLWFLYTLTASSWHLFGDFKDVIIGKIRNHRISRPRGWDLVVFVLGKILSISLLLAIPMLVHPWWIVLLFYMIVSMLIGVMMTVVFQLAHCVEEAEFLQPLDGGVQMADVWAVHQIRTTVDFSRNSRAVCWLFGGLNFQVVHHLFPQICHIHYPVLSRIVEKTCQEFGIPYLAHRSLLAGIVSHFRWLRQMGRPHPDFS